MGAAWDACAVVFGNRTQYMYSYLSPFVRITNDMAKLGISYQISEVHRFLSPVHAYPQLRHPTNHAISWHGMACRAPKS